MCSKRKCCRCFFSPLLDSYPLSYSRRSGEKDSQRFPSSPHGSHSCHRRDRRSWEINESISLLKVKVSLVSLEKVKVSLTSLRKWKCLWSVLNLKICFNFSSLLPPLMIVPMTRNSWKHFQVYSESWKTHVAKNWKLTEAWYEVLRTVSHLKVDWTNQSRKIYQVSNKICQLYFC